MCPVDSHYRRLELSCNVALFFLLGGGSGVVVWPQNPSHSWWASSMLLGRLRYGGTHTHTAAVYISRKGLQRGVQSLVLGQTEDWRGYAGAERGETGGEGVTTYLCSIITSKLAHTHRSRGTCSWPSTAVLEGPEVLARLGGCAPRLQVAPVGRKSLFCFQGSQLDVCV